MWGGIVASNFIILADDYQALEERINELKKGFEIDTDTINYSLEEEGIYSLVDELTTISLFGDRKFVVAKHAEALLSKSDKAFLELTKAMNDPQSENVLILVFMDGVDFSNEQYQKLKRFSSVIDVKTKNIKLDEYLKKQLDADGFKYSEDVVSLIVSYCDSLSFLRVMIDQLECFKYDTKEITTKDVHAMVEEPLDDNVYSLIDAVLANDKKSMLKRYKDLKLRSVQPSSLVSMLINKFQEMYNVHILVRGGVNQAGIAEIFNISSGRAYYMIKNAKDYNLNTIKKHLKLLNDLDYNIKTGKIDANIGIELYFLK